MPKPPLQHLLIETKLNRPVRSDRWVARPRLIQLLNEGLERRLTLVSAPAGYGKTTLIVQWLDQLPGPSAWLSLDHNDGEPERFLRYLTAAIRRTVPGFGTTIEPLLSAAQLPPPDYLADALVSDLVELSDRLILVLEDYQSLSSDDAQKILSRMVEYLSDRLHLVVITRVDPPWPLGRWRVREWLGELRAADLGFTLEEAHIFFDRGAESPFSPEAVELLQRRTEGWAAGLQLAQISLSAGDDPGRFAAGFSGSDRLVVDFLMDEVISRQPPEIQQFLAMTALFERFCAPLCDVLLSDHNPVPDSRRIIGLLDARNLFLVPLDSEHHWYRYHHLFQNLLKHRVKPNLSPERRALLHERAGKWFAAQGLIEEALQHFIAAGDVAAAAALVSGQLHAVLDEDPDTRFLERWLRLFPKTSRETLPSLMVVQATHYVYVYNLSGAMLLAEKAKILLEDSACSIVEPERSGLLGDVEVIFAFCLYWQGEAERALRHAERARRLVPPEHRTAQGAAIIYAAFSRALLGRRAAALKLLSAALLEDQAAGSRMAGQLLVCQAIIHTYGGDLRAAGKSARQVLAIYGTVPRYDYWRGAARFFLGSADYERNALGEAEDQFRHIVTLRYRMDPRIYHDGLLGLARIAWARGEAQEAADYVSAARKFAVEVKDPSSLAFSDAFELRLDALTGKDPSLPETPLPPADYNQPWMEPLSLILAEYRVNRGTTEDCLAALSAIEEALRGAERHHNTRQAIQFLALKAVALKGSGKPDNALQTLDEALRMAEPFGLIRTFVDRGPIVAELLKTLVKRNPGNSYMLRLLEAFEGRVTSEPEKASVAQLSAGLTNRELDVLLLLAERLTNKEVAARLGISPLTVKRHTANIYLKLDVRGRRQAVAAAGRFGLLSGK